VQHAITHYNIELEFNGNVLHVKIAKKTIMER